MPIDPSQVAWDDDPIKPPTSANQDVPLEISIVGGRQQIDPAQVQWDDEPVSAANDPASARMISGQLAQVDSATAGAQSTVGDMGTGQRMLVGAGKSVNDTINGVKQLGGAIADVIPGVDLTNWRQGVQSDIDESKRIDAPLMATGAGLAGNVLGNLAQVAAGGTALRGTSLAAAALPRTIAGNALQGGVMGAMQPVATGDSRVQNALIGTAFGGGSAAAVKGLAGAGGYAYDAARNLIRPGVSGTERRAAEVLLRESADPAALQRVAPSSVPGVQRTLAEESLDPGIARLERTVRSTGGQFDAIDRANNAARVRAIESFAGDDAAIGLAKRERDQQTKALLDQAMQDRGVNVGSVKKSLEDQIKATATRPSVQSALMDVKRSLDEAGDDVFSLYGTRKYIGDLLSGKAGGDKSYARAATRELMQVKNQLDEQLAEASPSFSSYLQKYQELSVPVNRMAIGQEMTSAKRGGAVLDPVTGAQVLTPAQFSKASRSLDDIAAKATGFAKAKAADILRPGDIAIIKSVQDDLERQAFRATAGSGGNSQTFERLGVQDRISRGAGRELLGTIPLAGRYAGGLMDMIDKSRNEQLKEKLAYLVANPEEARRVLASLQPNGQRIVRKALVQLSGGLGAAAAPAAASDQPLEISIQGGTPVPSEGFEPYR